MVREDGQIATMPVERSFGEVVVCEGAWYADTNLKWLGFKPGYKILIYGASGAIGIAGVQLAKAYGANVTVVVASCGPCKNRAPLSIASRWLKNAILLIVGISKY